MFKRLLASGTFTLGLMVFSTPQTFAITLEEAVQMAVSNNPEVGAANSSRDAILEELRQARALWLPRVDLELGIGPEFTTRPGFRNDNTDGDWQEEIRKESALVIRQRIFDGNEANSEIERETSRFNAAALRVAERAELIGLDTVNAYLEIIRLQELVDLAERNVQVHETILGQIRERVAGGIGSEADVTQTESRLSQARVTLTETTERLRSTYAAYATLTGQVPDSVQLPAFQDARLPASLDDALKDVSQSNPTLAIFGADARTAEAEIGLAESEFWPEVFLEARGEVNDDINGTRGWESQYQVMLRMRWNLYSGGRDSANRQEQLHDLNEALMLRHSAHLNAREEMRRSWYFLESAQSRVMDLEDAVERSRITRDSYVDQFNIGQRTLLDVLDAENELFNVSSQLASASNNELFAKYRIIALVGQLLTALNVQPPAQANGQAPSFSEHVFE